MSSTAPPGYELLRPLGEGRFTRVYLARRLADARQVALKLGPAARCGASFEREHAIGSRCRHPHLLQAFEAGGHQHQAFLATGYAAGGSLASAGLMGADHASALAAQAALGLAALHRAGWVHRDIKPANLLLRTASHMVVADFGSACRQGAASGLPAGALVGSPRHAAPEQAEGAAADGAADIYSLGTVLHELLTGEPAFQGETLAELRARHLVAPPPRLPARLAPWQPLLDAMLHKQPAQRPTAAQVARQLSRTTLLPSPQGEPT